MWEKSFPSGQLLFLQSGPDREGKFEGSGPAEKKNGFFFGRGNAVGGV